METRKSTIRELWTTEDWWAVWLGFIIIGANLAGLLPKIPKVGKWTDHPLDAFLVIKDGAVDGNILLPLAVLMIALAGLTTLAIVFTKVENPIRYFAGFLVQCFVHRFALIEWSIRSFIGVSKILLEPVMSQPTADNV